jgi:hypothetical protein
VTDVVTVVAVGCGVDRLTRRPETGIMAATAGIPLLRVEDCAKALAVRPSTVRHWLSTGALKRTKLGKGRRGVVRVHPDDLAAFVAGARQ